MTWDLLELACPVSWRQQHALLRIEKPSVLVWALECEACLPFWECIASLCRIAAAEAYAAPSLAASLAASHQIYLGRCRVPKQLDGGQDATASTASEPLVV